MKKNFFFKIATIKDDTVNHLKDLPISHNCDFYRLEGILEKQKIEINDCKVFVGEKLAYFFYGKPVFLKERWSLPVFLLFEFSDSSSIEQRIAPFDTGAYSKGFLDNVKKESPGDDSNKNSLDSFCKISPIGHDSKKCGKKIIHYFFENNLSYFGNDFKKNIQMYNSASHHYLTINADKLYYDQFDDRACSIEFQFKEDVDIKKNKLIYAYVPEMLLDSVKEDLLNINKDIFIEPYTNGKLKKGVKKLIGIASLKVEMFLKSINRI